MSLSFGLLTTIVLLFAPVALPAQSSDTTLHAPLPALIIARGGGIGIPLVPEAPYAGIEVSETAQTGKDGVVQTTNSTTALARDSKGRARVEDHDTRGQVSLITIYDPVARTKTILTPTDMRATVFSLSIPVTPPPIRDFVRAPSEDLGLATIEGVTVRGSRQTMNANTILGALVAKQVREQWFSDQLQIVMKLSNSGQTGESSLDAMTHVI